MPARGRVFDFVEKVQTCGSIRVGYRMSSTAYGR